MKLRFLVSVILSWAILGLVLAIIIKDMKVK